MILPIDCILQKTDSDCGVACVEMMLNYFEANKRGISGLSCALDGLQVRTIESYLREKGFCVVSGNFDLSLLKYYIRQKIPVICLLTDHYVLVKGFENRKIIYNCPETGEITESIVKFKKRWHNLNDDAILYNWGIAAYA